MASSESSPRFWDHVLSCQEAAAHLRILPDTFLRLVEKLLLPQPDEHGCWPVRAVDEAIDRLCRDGLPRDQRLPYSHPVARKLEVGPPRLHYGWRHGKANKTIYHPEHSAAFVREWLALERAYAATQVTLPVSPAQSRKSRPPSATAYERPHQSSAPPAEPRATSPPLAPAVRTEIGPLTTTNPQFKSARSNELLTEAEVVERYRNTISAGTLKNWRSAKRGPAFVKLGRRPLYPKALLERWEEENTVFCDLANGRTRIGDAIG